VTSHDDAAAEYRFFRVQCGESVAFSGRKNVLNQSAPLLVEIVPDFLPIECVDTGNCSIRWYGAGDLAFRLRDFVYKKRVHLSASLSSNACLRSTPQR
jgi:hypothetical protein